MQNVSIEHHSLCLFVEDWPLAAEFHPSRDEGDFDAVDCQSKAQCTRIHLDTEQVECENGRPLSLVI
jgi:hypothetical protein